MNETQNNEESRRPGISVFAVASMTFGVLGLAVLAWRLLAYRPWWSEYVARNGIAVLGFAGVIMGGLALAEISKRIATIVVTIALSPLLLILCSYALILLPRLRAFGYSIQRFSTSLTIAFFVIVLAVLTTREWRSWFEGRSRAGALAVPGIVLGVVLTNVWWVETCGPTSTALSNVCASNLGRLGDAMKAYANDNQGHYPDPNRWCDLLLQHTNTDRNWFLCPGVKWRWRRQVLPWPIPKNERCYYAMNPNCDPNSPDDTVLLFEIAGGWNISGGPERMTVENHLGRGGSVLVNGGYLPAVGADELDTLNWGVEGQDAGSAEQEINVAEKEGDSE